MRTTYYQKMAELNHYTIYHPCLPMLILFLFLSVQVAAWTSWPTMSPQIDVAGRAQRDVSKYVPIDQLSTTGVSLSSLVFGPYGYSSSSLGYFGTLMDLGLQSFIIDLYWNNFTSTWQLCPAPFPNNATTSLSLTLNVLWTGDTYECDPGLTVTGLVQTIVSYCGRTNSNADVNIIELFLRLNSIDSKYTNSSIYQFGSTDQHVGNSTLNESFAALGNLLFTPQDLANYRVQQQLNIAFSNYYNQSSTTLPTLETFVFGSLRRVLISVWDNNVSENTYDLNSQDNQTVFTLDSNLPVTVSSSSNHTLYNSCLELIDSFNDSSFDVNIFNNISLNAHFRFVIDDDVQPFTNETFRTYVQCGISPILNTTNYELSQVAFDESDSLGDIVDNFIYLSFWSWALGQPDGNNDDYNLEPTSDSEDEEPNNASKSAIQCVALFEDGWRVTNCYNEYYYACQNTEEPHKWLAGFGRTNYFTASTKDSCPDGYVFSIPHLSIEMMSLKDTIGADNITYPVWIDLNDITVTDCFVSGGPNAQCPYERTVPSSALVRLIAPNFIIAVVIVLFIFMEKVLRTNPIQSNRKRHWRKVINEYNEKNDYEGVPS